MDVKKFMIISAGVFVVVAAIFIFFLKPSGEEINPITAQAQQLIDNNQKEKAVDLLLENEKKLDNQGKKLLEGLKVELYPTYLEEAEKAFKDEEYVLALERYKEVLKVAPEGTDTKPIEKNIKELEELADEIIKLQEDYDQYMKTFNSTIEKSNALLTDFRSMLDQLEVGTISASQFVSHFKSEVDTSNTILNGLDSALSVSNQELLDIHKKVVKLANDQHNLILTSLNLTDANKVELVEKFKSQYLSIKQEQINLIQELNNFADEYHLEKSTIEDVETKSTTPLIEEEKSEETEQPAEEQQEESASVEQEETPKSEAESANKQEEQQK